MNLEKILENIRVSYEYEMNQDLEPNTRHRVKFELRCALVNAARPYATTDMLAKMVGKTNHTTALHMIREHDVYHNYSPQYRRNYSVALEVVEKYARKHKLMPRMNTRKGTVSTIQSEVETLNRTIKALQSRRDGMIESLQKQNKVSTFNTESTI
jgi:hypothetical protein